LAVDFGCDRIGLDRQPLRVRGHVEIPWWHELQIAARQVLRDALLVFVKRVRARVVGVPERLRLRYPLAGEPGAVRGIWLPRAVRRFVVQHQEKGPALRTVPDEVEAQLSDDVGDVASGVRLLAGGRVEHRVHVDALPGQYLPPIEAGRIAAQ